VTQEDSWNHIRQMDWPTLNSSYYNFAWDFMQLIGDNYVLMWEAIRQDDFDRLKTYWIGVYRIFSIYWPPEPEPSACPYKIDFVVDKTELLRNEELGIVAFHYNNTPVTIQRRYLSLGIWSGWTNFQDLGMVNELGNGCWSAGYVWKPPTGKETLRLKDAEGNISREYTITITEPGECSTSDFIGTDQVTYYSYQEPVSKALEKLQSDTGYTYKLVVDYTTVREIKKGVWDTRPDGLSASDLDRQIRDFNNDYMWGRNKVNKYCESDPNGAFVYWVRYGARLTTITEEVPELFVTAFVDNTNVVTGEDFTISGQTLPGATLELWEHNAVLFTDVKLKLVPPITAKADGSYEFIVNFSEAGNPTIYTKAKLAGEEVNSLKPYIQFTVTSIALDLFVTAAASKTDVLVGETFIVSGETLPGATVKLVQHLWGLFPDKDIEGMVTTADVSGNYMFTMGWEEGGEPAIYAEATLGGVSVNSSDNKIQFMVMGEVPELFVNLVMEKDVAEVNSELILRVETLPRVEVKIMREVFGTDITEARENADENGILRYGFAYPKAGRYYFHANAYRGLVGKKTSDTKYGTVLNYEQYEEYLRTGKIPETVTDWGIFWKDYKKPLLIGGGILALYVLLKASKATMPSFILGTPSVGKG